MGSRWGINRTVAQIHALLFSPKPLHAEEIATLAVARSNVEQQPQGATRVGDRARSACPRRPPRSFRIPQGCLADVPNHRGRNKRRESTPPPKCCAPVSMKLMANPTPTLPSASPPWSELLRHHDRLLRRSSQAPRKGVLSGVTRLRGKERKLLVLKGGRAG